MSDGKGKIIDGMSYQSTLPEEYAKVKHQRDKVVKAFNILKQHSDNVEAELAEMRLLLEEAQEAGGRHTFGNTLYDAINKVI